MSYQVVLQSEAVIDIQVAYEWYEQQRAGLGDEMIEEIEDLKVIVIAVRRISQKSIH